MDQPNQDPATPTEQPMPSSETPLTSPETPAVTPEAPVALAPADGLRPAQSEATFQQQGAPVPAPHGANGLAIAGLVVGIIALITAWVPFLGLGIAVVAVILSILGLRGHKPLKGLAIGGLVTGALGLLWALFVTGMLLLAMFAIANIPETGTQTPSQNQTQEQGNANNDTDDVSKSGTMGAYTVTVNSIKHGHAPQNTPIAEDQEYVVLNLTVKNNSNMMPAFSDAGFSLVDENGEGGATSHVTVDPGLSGQSIPVGESATGNLVFVVAKNATSLTLTYTMTHIGADGKPSEMKDTLRVE